MSVPARSIRSSASPVAVPVRTPSPRRNAARPRDPGSRARPRAREWRHPAFFLFAAIVVSILVIGLVAVNAMLVQTTYRMQAVRQQVADLAEEQIQLQDQVASLSSPETVASWASQRGMTMPEPGDTIILPVPGVASVSDADRGGNR